MDLMEVPVSETIPFTSVLPETNLPGFARAFHSLSFQWLAEDHRSRHIDWEKDLPIVQWPEDKEIIDT